MCRRAEAAAFAIEPSLRLYFLRKLFIALLSGGSSFQGLEGFVPMVGIFAWIGVIASPVGRCHPASAYGGRGQKNEVGGAKGAVKGQLI